MTRQPVRIQFDPAQTEVYIRSGWLPPGEAEKLRAELADVREDLRVERLEDARIITNLRADAARERAKGEALAEALEGCIQTGDDIDEGPWAGINPAGLDKALSTLARYRKEEE